MKVQLAIVERIEPAGTEGMYEATLAVRESVGDTYHGMAITVIGCNLTECITRTHKVLVAFNGEAK